MLYNSFNDCFQGYQQWADRLRTLAGMGDRRGLGWREGKKCFVGCPTDFGLPKAVVELCEALFLGCDDEVDAIDFAYRLAGAIRVGANYSLLIHYWGEWMVLNKTYGAVKHICDERIAEVGYAHRTATVVAVPHERWQNAGLAVAECRGNAKAFATKAVRAAFENSFDATKTVEDLINDRATARDAKAAFEATKVAFYMAYATEGVEDEISADYIYHACESSVKAYAGDDINAAKNIRGAQREQFLRLLASNVFTD